MSETNRSVCANDCYLFLAGASLGVGLGMLFAPKAGHETRSHLRHKVNEGKQYVARQGRDITDKATEIVEKGKDTIEQQRSSLSAAIDAGKQAYRDTVRA